MACSSQVRRSSSEGAASAVGLMGMQVAKFLGARMVIGTSRSPERCARLKEFGADVAINTEDKNWVDQVLKATNGKGVDLLIDFLVGPLVNGSLQVTRVGGRMINIGRLSGESGEFNFDLHNMRRISYIGASFRMRTPLESLEVIMKASEALGPALSKGALRMPIDKAIGRTSFQGLCTDGEERALREDRPVDRLV